MCDARARIDAIAAKALMLEPGERFVVSVAGDEERALEHMESIGDAVEDHYNECNDFVPSMADPSSLAIAAGQIRPGHNVIVIARYTKEQLRRRQNERDRWGEMP